MKKRIKLRDMTEKQFEAWKSENCVWHKKRKNCVGCPFSHVHCGAGCIVWHANKGMYSDKFLNQEVEIDISDILTKAEKEYLEFVLEPYRHSFFNIRIERWNASQPTEAIEAVQKSEDGNILLIFSLLITKEMPFDGIDHNHSFTLEDLGL